MSALCVRVRRVDISSALDALPKVEFIDTGGSNGCISRPHWLPSFVEGLNLDGEVIFSVLRMLPAYRGIPPHVDSADLSPVNVGRRYHVPLVTHPEVTMRWPDEDEEHHLEAGWLYEVDYAKLHEVVHRAPVARIHVQVNVRGLR